MLDNMRKQEEYAQKQKQEQEQKRAKDSKPTLDLKAYEGTYGGELYGNATVTLVNGELELAFLPAPRFKATLRHWQYNTFCIRFAEFPSLPEGRVNFLIDAQGKVYEMQVDVPNPDFDFTELKFRRQE
jgi:hypothetical protein